MALSGFKVGIYVNDFEIGMNFIDISEIMKFKMLRVFVQMMPRTHKLVLKRVGFVSFLTYVQIDWHYWLGLQFASAIHFGAYT